MKFNRLAIGTVLAVGVVMAAASAGAQEMKFFRIASGSAGGTYYPMAGLIAQVIGAVCKTLSPSRNQHMVL